MPQWSLRERRKMHRHRSWLQMQLVSKIETFSNKDFFCFKTRSSCFTAQEASTDLDANRTLMNAPKTHVLMEEPAKMDSTSSFANVGMGTKVKDANRKSTFANQTPVSTADVVGPISILTLANANLASKAKIVKSTSTIAS